MSESKVYWIDLRTTPAMSMLKKLDKLLRAAGLASLDLSEKYTALKIHFGESGNMSYIRPPYVAVIANLVRELGGKPFLTDSNTLYSGRRTTPTITSAQPSRTASRATRQAATSSWPTGSRATTSSKCRL